MSLSHNQILNSNDLKKSLIPALNKTLNSLSWRPQIANMTAVGGRNDLFRISLGDYGWTESTWSKITAEYPYDNIEHPRLIRGDWLMYYAVRPPLYHEILKLPTNSDILENQLGVDVLANISRGDVIRSGFRGSDFSGGSGVSKNNRLIERHQTRFGAYWKSYDFSSTQEEQNLFLFPLGPGKSANAEPFAFRHAGGEIIFNLPNGLQAYLLVDAKGSRIDIAPSNIVQDSTRVDAAIVNGISCISCHSQGMREHYDEVLNFATQSTSRFTSEAMKKIRSIYKNKDQLQQVFAEDRARFSEALEEMGLDSKARIEPIRIETDIYESPIDLQRAAAEFNFPLEKFQNLLDLSPRLQGFRTQLLTGILTRQEFESQFILIKEELNRIDAHPLKESLLKEQLRDQPKNQLDEAIVQCDPLRAASVLEGHFQLSILESSFVRSLERLCESVALEIMDLLPNRSCETLAQKKLVLHIAVGGGANEVLKRLVDIPEVPLSVKNSKGDSAFHFALLRNSPAAALILLSDRIKAISIINQGNDRGLTGLHLATRQALPKPTSELLSFPEMKVNARDQAQKTALFYAARLARENPSRIEYHKIKQILSQAGGEE